MSRTLDPKKLIILDRDGVINQDSDNYIKSVGEWIPINGSIEAICDLYKAGYTICVATNQSGLARGYFTLKDLEAMHAKLNNLVQNGGGKIHSIHFCPHGPDDGCNCRKPLAGLFQQIANEFHLTDLTSATTIGDSLRDLQAGKQLHCDTILVRTGKGQRTLDSRQALPEGTIVFDSLRDFANSMI